VRSQFYLDTLAEVLNDVKACKKELLNEVEWESLSQMQPRILKKELNYTLIDLVDEEHESINFGKGPIELRKHVDAITNLPRGVNKVVVADVSFR
jgi:hypothetical protein